MADAAWADIKVDTEEKDQLITWARICAAVDNGMLTREEALDWAWAKAKNGVDVTITRIRRYDRKPGQDSRRVDGTWCTIAAELGTKKNHWSRLAQDAKKFVLDELKQRGHIYKPGQSDNEVHVDEFVGSRGVMTISIEVKHLRRFMARKAAEKDPQRTTTASR